MSLNHRGNHTTAGAYANLGLRTDIEAATPHRLILMLLDGAIEKIRAAGAALERGDVAAKGANVSWAMSIVDGLRASLDRQNGGDVAANLDRLYDYVCRILLRGNLDNDAATFAEAVALIGEIRSAWVAIRPQVESGTGRAVDNDLGALSHAVR